MEAAPFSSKAPHWVSWYIDGFNLYHAIDALKDPPLKWLDLRSLAASYLRPNQSLDRVVFSTALSTWDAEKRERHLRYVKALEATDVEVAMARFDKVTRRCRTTGKSCAFHEEKQSDVNLAVAALSDAYEGRVQTIFMLTADSDQIPTFRHLASRFEHLRVFLVAPPKRLSHARQLGEHAHGVFELTAGRLRQHLLPRTILDKSGKTIATRPAKYS